MRSTLDCIPCFVKHAVHTARMASPHDSVREAVAKEVLKKIAAMDMADPPPLMAREINSVIRSLAGAEDLYVEQKDKSTEYAKSLFETMRKDLEGHHDKFEAYVRLAIAGNIIDYGVDSKFRLEDAHEKMLNALEEPIDHAALRTLKTAMERAGSILYIADNCGEAVFDRFLIEPYKAKTTLAVRGEPILNDLTRRELSASGLENLASRVIDTGDFTPGVSLAHSSEEFMEEFGKAELIVAKGQGNYETLSDCPRPIAFLFRAKCKVVARQLGGVRLGSFQIIASNIPASWL